MQLRVAVFRRADDSVLCDSTFGGNDNGPPPPAAPKVWALMQVLIPFARELGGGGVRSVVLRDADIPTDARAFGASRPRPPMEITVAHGTHFAVTVTSSAGRTPSTKALCDHLHKFILTTLHHRPNNEIEVASELPLAPDGNVERGESFDIRAYMESFVSSGSNSSSFLSSDASSDRSHTRTGFGDKTPETPLVKIDTNALREEIKRAVESFF